MATDYVIQVASLDADDLFWTWKVLQYNGDEGVTVADGFTNSRRKALRAATRAIRRQGGRGSE